MIIAVITLILPRGSNLICECVLFFGYLHQKSDCFQTFPPLPSQVKTVSQDAAVKPSVTLNNAHAS